MNFCCPCQNHTDLPVDGETDSEWEKSSLFVQVERPNKYWINIHCWCLNIKFCLSNAVEYYDFSNDHDVVRKVDEFNSLIGCQHRCKNGWRQPKSHAVGEALNRASASRTGGLCMNLDLHPWNNLIWKNFRTSQYSFCPYWPRKQLQK